MVEPHSSNFRVITTSVLSVRIFRKFTVMGIREWVSLGKASQGDSYGDMGTGTPLRWPNKTEIGTREHQKTVIEAIFKT